MTHDQIGYAVAYGIVFVVGYFIGREFGWRSGYVFARRQAQESLRPIESSLNEAREALVDAILIADKILN